MWIACRDADKFIFCHSDYFRPRTFISSCALQLRHLVPLQFTGNWQASKPLYTLPEGSLKEYLWCLHNRIAAGCPLALSEYHFVAARACAGNPDVLRNLRGFEAVPEWFFSLLAQPRREATRLGVFLRSSVFGGELPVQREVQRIVKKVLEAQQASCNDGVDDEGSQIVPKTNFDARLAKAFARLSASLGATYRQRNDASPRSPWQVHAAVMKFIVDSEGLDDRPLNFSVRDQFHHERPPTAAGLRAGEFIL